MSNLVGFTAVTAAATFFVASTFCLKYFSIGLCYQLVIYLFAMFLPAFLGVLYYNHNDTSNNKPSSPFNFSELFMNKVRMSVGVTNAVYMLSAYTAFKLLPFSFSFPLLYIYPILMMFFGYYINEESMPTKLEAGLFATITFGIILMCVSSMMTETNSNYMIGTILMFIAACSMALYFTFIKNTVKNRTMLARSTKEVYDEAIHRNAYHTTGIQLMEATTIPLIITSLIAIIMTCVPSRWITKWNRMGVPESITSLSLGNGLSTIFTLFLTYMLLSFGCNISGIIADNNLSTSLFTSSEYITYIFIGSLVGFMCFDEQMPALKIAGLFLIIVAAIINIISKLWDNRKNKTASQPNSDILYAETNKQ